MYTNRTNRMTTNKLDAADLAIIHIDSMEAINLQPRGLDAIDWCETDIENRLAENGIRVCHETVQAFRAELKRAINAEMVKREERDCFSAAHLLSAEVVTSGWRFMDQGEVSIASDSDMAYLGRSLRRRGDKSEAQVYLDWVKTANLATPAK